MFFREEFEACEVSVHNSIYLVLCTVNQTFSDLIHLFRGRQSAFVGAKVCLSVTPKCVGRCEGAFVGDKSDIFQLYTPFCGRQSAFVGARVRLSVCTTNSLLVTDRIRRRDTEFCLNSLLLLSFVLLASRS